jgi:Mce-associated membrane protein
MTDQGTTYRRIGDRQEQAPGTDRPGLRRIGEGHRPAPAAPATEETAAEETAPAGDAAVTEGVTTGKLTARKGTARKGTGGKGAVRDDEWSVPSPDEPDDAAEAPEAAVPTAGRRRIRRQSRATTEKDGRRASGRGALVVVSVLAALFAAAAIVLGVLYVQQSDQDGLRSSALSAARSDGVILSSYDYRNLTGPGSDWTKVEAASTPTFRKNFLSTSGDLGKLLTQYNAVATGKVLNAGIQSLSGNRAVVLLFIDQTVNNTVQKGPGTTQPLRSLLTLVHQNGKWLIDDLQVPK